MNGSVRFKKDVYKRKITNEKKYAKFLVLQTLSIIKFGIRALFSVR